MLNHSVTSLTSTVSPTGLVLDRFDGPGWTASPDKMLKLLRPGGHVFGLAGTKLKLAAVRENDGAWAIAVMNSNGERVSPANLPHWRVERPRSTKNRKTNWLQDWGILEAA
jgi:hypothetical protein